MKVAKLDDQVIGAMIVAAVLVIAALLLASGLLTPRRTPMIAPRTQPLDASEIRITLPRMRPPARKIPAAAPAPAPAAVDPARYVIKHIMPIDGPMHLGDHHWDERGAPAGPIMITIDLAAQSLSVFRGGYEIGTAAILYGGDDKPTPLGVFPITQKDADHVSNLYDAPMPYMLRLTNGGISIHGTSVGEGSMTHGCIGVPTPFAKKLFAVVKLGDTVIITRGKMVGVGSAIST